MPCSPRYTARLVRRAAVRPLWLAPLLAPLGGCAFWGSVPDPEPAPVVVAVAPDPAAPRLAPLETRHFTLTSRGQELIGETQVLFTREDNTFTQIGRQYDLGYEELRHANPTVDQFLPGEATPVYLPTQTILPDSPR